MMKRRDTTAGPNTDALGNGCKRGTRDRGVGTGTAKGVAMALGRPDGVEAIAIEIFRTLQHQAVLVVGRPIVVSPHEKTKAKRQVFAP